MKLYHLSPDITQYVAYFKAGQLYLMCTYSTHTIDRFFLHPVGGLWSCSTLAGSVVSGHDV
jgi:hypothetical protein